MLRRKRLERRTPSLLEHIPTHAVSSRIPIHDQDLVGRGIVACNDDRVSTEVIFLTEVEVRQESHVDIHQHRFAVGQQLPERGLRLLCARGDVGLDGDTRATPDRLFQALDFRLLEIGPTTVEGVRALTTPHTPAAPSRFDHERAAPK